MPNRQAAAAALRLLAPKTQGQPLPAFPPPVNARLPARYSRYRATATSCCWLTSRLPLPSCFAPLLARLLSSLANSPSLPSARLLACLLPRRRCDITPSIHPSPARPPVIRSASRSSRLVSPRSSRPSKRNLLPPPPRYGIASSLSATSHPCPVLLSELPCQTSLDSKPLTKARPAKGPSNLDPPHHGTTRRTTKGHTLQDLGATKAACTARPAGTEPGAIRP